MANPKRLNNKAFVLFVMLFVLCAKDTQLFKWPNPLKLVFL